MLACGPDCGCGSPLPLVTRPTQLGGFGFVAEIAAAAQAAAAVAGAAKELGVGKKKKKAPPAPPPPPPSIFDSFGPQYRPLVIAGMVGLGGLVLMRLVR